MFNEVFCKFGGGGGTEPLGGETHPAGLYADKPLILMSNIAPDMTHKTLA